MPTRAEQARLVSELRARGYLQREVAELLGISRSYVSMIDADPDASKERLRKESYSRPCVECGAPLSGSDGRGPNAPVRCHPCAAKRTGRRLRGGGPRGKAVIALLASRGTMRFSELRDALGVTSNHASPLLDRLLSYGIVERIGRGKYQLAKANREENDS